MINKKNNLLKPNVFLYKNNLVIYYYKNNRNIYSFIIIKKSRLSFSLF
jgi:hypothetical protein